MDMDSINNVNRADIWMPLHHEETGGGAATRITNTVKNAGIRYRNPQVEEQLN